MKLTVDFKELNQFDQQMKQWPAKTTEAGAWAVQRAAQVAAVEMRQEAPKAFSLLTQSIKVDQISPTVAWVGPHVTYAWWVEKGRRPGGKMPPRSALLDWVRVKFQLADNRAARSLAWVIARKIQQKGIPAQPFVEPRRASIGPRLQQWVLERLALVFRGTG